MKNTFSLGLMAATFLLAGLPTLAQQPNSKAQQPNKTGMAAKMPEHCAMMMQMHQKKEASTKAQDVKLKGLMATMDKASGDQKMKAMAAVISELVAQRTTRQEMMGNMQSQMMGHMMEHMQSGDKTSMMQCPMMKDGGMMGGGMGMMGKGGMMGHDMSKMKAK